MPTLPERPTLADLQRYVVELEDERGFADQSVRDKCLLLGEEVGELFRAIRHTTGLAVDTDSDEVDANAAGEELADVLIFLCAIANRLDVDLEDAFRRKEAINAARRWIKRP